MNVEIYDLIYLAIGFYLATGVFWAGASFATAWYERCHKKLDYFEWVWLLAVSIIGWPMVAAGFFVYTSGPGCGGSGVHK